MTAPWGAGPALFMWIAGFFLIIVSAGFALAAFPDLTEMQIAVLIEIASVIPILAYLRLNDLPVSVLGLRKGSFSFVLALSTVLGLASLGLSFAWGTILSFLISGYEQYIQNVPRITPSSLEELIGWGIITLLLVGPMEEILSRGFVQQGMERRFGKKWGLIIASLMFGVIHFEPSAAANAFVIGLVLGYAYQRTGNNLLIPIGMHVIFDWAVLILTFLFPIT